MRVIAGTLGGRSFDSPRGHRTHPMSDKIRGAIFNMLGDLNGLKVLDAFAGSGALAIEAISRGAASAVAVDSDKTAYQTISANLMTLGLQDDIRAIRQNVVTWSGENPHAKYDIVLADPPYDDLRVQYIERLASHVDAEGLLVLSWPGSVNPPDLTAFGLKLIQEKSYGDARLAIYRRSGRAAVAS